MERDGTSFIALVEWYLNCVAQKWIFCVETRIFALALYEYYQDLYAHTHTIAPDIIEEKNDSDTHEPSSRRTVHPDAWTLPYLVIFTKATETIDDDNSGFIRISEANKFTSRIPEGWTLPRYCAYLVEGTYLRAIFELG